MQSHIGCICLAFLHCAFSCVSSNGLPARMQSHIGCICLTFLHCVFSCVSSNCLPERKQSHIGCICSTFLQWWQICFLEQLAYPIHNKPLRSFMCGINHLHMNSTQIKDQIFPSGILFTLHTFISILLDLSHLTLQGWNYLVDRESHSKFTRMRSDSNWFVRAFIRIMSQNYLSLSSNCPLSLFNLNICLHWKKK